MIRRRYKLLRYLVVIIPLALTFFSPFSESVSRWLFSRYEIRWQVTKPQANQKTQLVTVRNNGKAPLPKTRIHLKIVSAKPAPVADFSFARLEGGPQISFLDSIARSDSTANPAQPDLAKLMPVLDSHSNPHTLFALEQTFNKILSSRLRTNKQLNGTLTALENANHNYDDWHGAWLQKCNEQKVASAACDQGITTIEGWEAAKGQLLEKGRQKWYESTGVEILSNASNLSPSGDIDFTFDLGGDESCFLKVDYNPDPSVSISTDVEVLSTSIANTNQVFSQGDLSAPLPFFIFKYHLNSLVAFLIILIVALWFAWPVLMPKQLLPMHKVFRIAMSTGDEEYWEHAYQRYRFHVGQQFRDLRQAAGKPHLNAEPEQLLDYVRNRLITKYGENPKNLASEKKLKQFISAELETLVALPT